MKESWRQRERIGGREGKIEGERGRGIEGETESLRTDSPELATYSCDVGTFSG